MRMTFMLVVNGQLNEKSSGLKFQDKDEDNQDRLATSKGESVGTLNVCS